MIRLGFASALMGFCGWWLCFHVDAWVAIVIGTFMLAWATIAAIFMMFAIAIFGWED